MISVRCFDSLESAAHLRAEVNAINRVSAHPDPFSTFEFYENYLAHDEHHAKGEGLRLWFLTAFSDGRLVGYAAFKQVDQRVLWSKTPALGFLVTHDADRPHVVAAPGALAQVSEAFCAYLFAHGKAWDFLEFHQQDASSSLFPLPGSVDCDGHLVHEWPSLENCTIPVRWTSLHAYLQSLSKKFRSNLSRQMRGLLGAGKVELLTSSDPAITPTLFELCRSVEPHSWKPLAGADIGRHPERIAYFKGLLDPRQPMRISIQVLLLDGLPIAGLITGSFMHGLYGLHIVYDRRASRLAPGSAMLLTGMRQAIDGGHASFNLLSGFGYFKARWLAQVTPTRIAQIYRVGSLPYWRRILGDLKRSVSDRPATEATAHFNPSRRAVDEREDQPGSTDLQPLLQLRLEDRLRIAALVAAARNGPCEVLGTADLAAVMSIDLQSIAKRTPRETSCRAAERAPARPSPEEASAIRLEVRPSVA